MPRKKTEGQSRPPAVKLLNDFLAKEKIQLVSPSLIESLKKTRVVSDGSVIITPGQITARYIDG